MMVGAYRCQTGEKANQINIENCERDRKTRGKVIPRTAGIGRKVELKNKNYKKQAGLSK